ncbi:organic hydroperoxide resistance protein [Leucosporidium creatinivorum]|uniref:Organic hydroperoxide resistance protein n=1 Tax=Leucosporidium creatinivorum TaxID=106004 RepID=A0A1Y2FWN9_9BASI|nr:organic hydroperoxide resistance protein [Leucosporidium creatinivorum]
MSFALRQTARLALRSTPIQARSLSTLSPNLYTASSLVTGSRANGHATTKEGNVELKMQMPKQMGGTDHKKGVSDPEQLFGIAYSTCFLSALNAVHSAQNPSLKALSKDAGVRTEVSVGKDASGALEGFLLAIRLEILTPPLRAAGLDDAGIQKLVEAAHDMCPYSRAIKGNVEVEIALVEA